MFENHALWVQTVKLILQKVFFKHALKSGAFEIC